jgi:hypothetical protein
VRLNLNQSRLRPGDFRTEVALFSELTSLLLQNYGGGGCFLDIPSVAVQRLAFLLFILKACDVNIVGVSFGNLFYRNFCQSTKYVYIHSSLGWKCATLEASHLWESI